MGLPDLGFVAGVVAVTVDLVHFVVGFAAVVTVVVIGFN